MRRWTGKDVVALAKENAALVEQAINRALDDKHDGLPSGKGDKRASLNDDGTPQSRTQLLAFAKATDDPVRMSLQRMIRHLESTRTELRSLLALEPDDVMRLTLPAGAGWCVNCDRFCPGGPDRLRAGRCEKCYKFRLRRGREWNLSADEARDPPEPDGGDSGDNESEVA